MKKKLLAIVLSMSMAMSFVACKSQDANEDASSTGGETAVTGAATDTSSAVKSADLIYCTEVVPDNSRQSTANTDEQYDRLTIAYSIETTELQPYNVDDAGKSQAIYEIYEPLYDMYGLDDYRPRLAAGDPVVVDDTHYQVTIYDNIKDSDGNSIKASDVAFSYNLAFESGYGNDWNYYSKAEAIDDDTVEFTWTQALDSLTAFTNLFTKVNIVSEKAYNDHNMATDPVGTGPYKLKEFVAGANVTLEARDDYWQSADLRSERAAAKVKTIEFDLVGDDSLVLVALEEGHNDFKFMRDDWSMFQAGGQYEGVANLYLHKSTQSHSILPNCSPDSLCSDKNLRLAMFYAIDRQSICQAISADTKSPSNVDVSKVVADYQDAWDSYAQDTYQNVYDPELAKEYLEKSSYDGSTLTILLESNAEKKTEAQLVQGYLTAVGIKCELATYDHSVISNYMADSSGWDILIYSGNANDYAISKWMLQYGAAKNNGTTVNFITDDTFQNMLTQCASRSGYSAEATEKIGEYIIDNAYAYSTFYASEIYAFAPKFASFYTDFWGMVVWGACDYYLDEE